MKDWCVVVYPSHSLYEYFKYWIIPASMRQEARLEPFKPEEYDDDDIRRPTTLESLAKLWDLWKEVPDTVCDKCGHQNMKKVPMIPVHEVFVPPPKPRKLGNGWEVVGPFPGPSFSNRKS